MTMQYTIKDNPTEHDIDFLVDVGYALEKGIGFEQDFAMALEIYSLCAVKGNVMALNNVGWMYLRGLGTEKNVKFAIVALEKAAEAGSHIAMINLGSIYEDTEYTDYEKACYWYRMAAEAGYIKGIFNYANMLHYGRGVKRDYAEARRLFEAIAEYDPSAYFYLGLYYQNGLGVEADYLKAHQYYLLGTQYDDPYCFCQVGVMYATGQGVVKDEQLAFDYYMKAAELDDPLAFTNVAYCYEVGQGVEQNLDTAISWYTKAADRGEAHGSEALGRLGTSFEPVCEITSAAVKSPRAPNRGDAVWTPRKETLVDAMWRFVNSKRLEPSEIYAGANLIKQTFWNLISGKYPNPSKQLMLAVAIGMKLNVEEARHLLYTAGYALNELIPLDGVVLGFIEREEYSVFKINQALEEKGLPLLGSKIK